MMYCKELVMAETSKINYFECDLQSLLESKGWTIEEAAVALGDSSHRLRRVSEGLEPLGKTATLAAIALKYNLDAIVE